MAWPKVIELIKFRPDPMKKYCLTIAIALIFPLVAYASWWNPTTWNWNPVVWVSYLFGDGSPQLYTSSSTLSEVTSTIASASSSVEINNLKTRKIETPPRNLASTTNPINSQNSATQNTNISSRNEEPQNPATPPASAPPPNSTFCNGTYYSPCLSGQDFVCPAIGAAYCQASQQQQEVNSQVAAQAQANAAAVAQQQKMKQINALTVAYNVQNNALQQQIIDIKTKYYASITNINNMATNLARANGLIQQATDLANSQIAQIQLQEQQLYLTYTERINALQ